MKLDTIWNMECKNIVKKDEFSKHSSWIESLTALNYEFSKYLILVQENLGGKEQQLTKKLIHSEKPDESIGGVAIMISPDALKSILQMYCFIWCFINENLHEENKVPRNDKNCRSLF